MSEYKPSEAVQRKLMEMGSKIYSWRNDTEDRIKSCTFSYIKEAVNDEKMTITDKIWFLEKVLYPKPDEK